MTDLLTPIQAALALPHAPLPQTQAGALPSTFAVTDLAAASIGAAGQAVAQLIEQQTGRLPSVSVDRRLASLWFSSSIRPVGWQVPPLWDPVAGDYASADGWIRLHTNAPHHVQRPSGYWGLPLIAQPWRAKSQPGKPTNWNRRLSMRAVVRRRCVAGKPGSSILKAWQ